MRRRPRRWRSSPTRSVSSIDGLGRPGRRQHLVLSRTLRDYFLYAADQGAIEIHWSQQILDEMSRNLRENIGISQADTTRLEALMNAYTEYALIDIEPDDSAVIEAAVMDPKDRHVLAAAVGADADILLTDNTRHFPRGWMAERGIELLTAGELLARLVEVFPDKLCAAHEKTLRYSPKQEADVFTTLEAIIGKPTADAMRGIARPRRSDDPGSDSDG